MIKKLINGTFTRLILASGAVLGLIIGIISAGTIAIIAASLEKNEDSSSQKKLAQKR